MGDTAARQSLDRTTRYVAAVRTYMHHVGHATNTEIRLALCEEFPGISATTVHRITARLFEHRELQLAPSAHDGAMRYDVNVRAHDHFMCHRCGVLRDAQLDAVIRPLIQDAVGDGCVISGSLTVSGICKQCHKEGI